MTAQELMKSAPAGASLIQTYKNGNIKVAYRVKCWKCAGQGVISAYAHVYAGECFECNGTGWVDETETIMTPENAAKADARRAKREAQIAEQIAAENAKREAEEQRKAEEQAKREAEIAAVKAISQHVGNIGDRVEMTLTLDHTATWEQPSYAGYGTDTMHIHAFKDTDGNTFIWKTSNGVYVALGNGQYKVAEKGNTVTLKGTIKDHSEYDGEKQTVLTRCKIIDVIEA